MTSSRRTGARTPVLGAEAQPLARIAMRTCGSTARPWASTLTPTRTWCGWSRRPLWLPCHPAGASTTTRTAVCTFTTRSPRRVVGATRWTLSSGRSSSSSGISAPSGPWPQRRGGPRPFRPTWRLRTSAPWRSSTVGAGPTPQRQGPTTTTQRCRLASGKTLWTSGRASSRCGSRYSTAASSWALLPLEVPTADRRNPSRTAWASQRLRCGSCRWASTLGAPTRWRRHRCRRAPLALPGPFSLHVPLARRGL
mmetsp:Transcript_4566/g.14183  ORF Transcript_4566/g.14183 Transcript_4566/m.14183 type:complete len:252 (-) Transcript_4566:630-1385(-)